MASIETLIAQIDDAALREKLGREVAEMRRVIVRAGSYIDGDIQIFDGRRVLVKKSRVGGNIQLKDNAALSEVLRNTVDGDVQLFSNPGGFSVWYNRIDGNLQCKSNGTPRRGDGNIVQGDKEDQCRGR